MIKSLGTSYSLNNALIKMKLKERLISNLLQVVLVLSSKQIENVRADCSSFDKDICLCYEQDDCFYKESRGICVDKDTDFGNYMSCIRRNAFYVYGSNICGTRKESGECQDGVAHYAINLGGDPMTVDGIKYEGDSRSSGSNACTQSFSTGVYKTVIEGTPDKRQVGKCKSYSIPVGDDGVYELMISSSPLKHRCMDIKLGGRSVGIDVDIWELGGQFQCYPPVNLIVKYLVDKKANKVYIRGQKRSLPLSNDLELEFCYGHCGYNENAVYSANAFLVLRYDLKPVKHEKNREREKEKSQRDSSEEKSTIDRRDDVKKGISLHSDPFGDKMTIANAKEKVFEPDDPKTQDENRFKDLRTNLGSRLNGDDSVLKHVDQAPLLQSKSSSSGKNIKVVEISRHNNEESALKLADQAPLLNTKGSVKDLKILEGSRQNNDDSVLKFTGQAPLLNSKSSNKDIKILDGSRDNNDDSLLKVTDQSAMLNSKVSSNRCPGLNVLGLCFKPGLL